MKILRYFAALVLLSGAAFAQAGWYGNVAQAMTYTNGVRVEQPLPGSQILVCTAVGPCDLVHAATIYTDSSAATVASNPFTADNQGNFGFWALAGNYQYTFTYRGNAYGPFMVTIGANDANVVHATGNETISGDKTWTGTSTFLGPVVISGSSLAASTFIGNLQGNVTGNITGNGASFLQKINNIRYCDQFAGSTADVKINAAVSDLPVGGGVVDCRGFGATTQTIAATVNVGLNSGSGKTVTLLIDRTTAFVCTITNNTPCWVRSAGSSIVASGTVAYPNSGFTLSGSAAVSNILLTQDLQSSNLVGGLVEGVMVSGHTGATVSDALLGVQNPLQVTQFSNITVSANGTNNAVGLKIYGTAGTTVGNVQFNNIQVDMIGSTGSRPVWIGCAAAGSLTPVACPTINTVTFLGASALVHPSAGLPIVTIESQNGAGGQNVVGNIGFYGTQLESHSGTDIGILVNGAESVHIYGVFGTANTSPGADLIKLAAPAGTTLDGIDIRGVDNQGNWTNTLNNTVNSSAFAFGNYPRLNYAYSAASKVANVVEGGPVQFGAGSGILGTGKGVKHQRFGGTTATAATAGATSTDTFTWTTPFADANYTVVCNGITPTGTPALSINAAPIAASVTVRTTAITAAASNFANVECWAVHD